MLFVSGVLAHVAHSVEARSNSTRSSAEFDTRSEHVRHISPTEYISTAYNQARMETRSAINNMTRRLEDVTDSLRNRRHTRERRQHSMHNVLRRLSGRFKRQHGEHVQPTGQRPATQPTTAPPATAPPTAELSAAEPAATAPVDDDTAMLVDEAESSLETISTAGHGLRFTPVVDLKTFVFLGESRIGGFTVQTMDRRQYNRQRHLRRLSSCSNRPRSGHNLKSNAVVEANPIDAFAVQATQRRQRARMRWTVELPERRGYAARPKLIKRWLIPRAVLVLVGNDHGCVGVQGADVPPSFATEADGVADTYSTSNGSVLGDEDVQSSNTMGSNVADNSFIELDNRPEHEDAVAASDDGLEVEADEEVATSDDGLEFETDEEAAESVDYLAPDLSDSSHPDTISRTEDSDLASLVNFINAAHGDLNGLVEDMNMVAESQAINDSERDLALTTLRQRISELAKEYNQVKAGSPDAFARAMKKYEEMWEIAEEKRWQERVLSAFGISHIRSMELNDNPDNADLTYVEIAAIQCLRFRQTALQALNANHQNSSN